MTTRRDNLAPFEKYSRASERATDQIIRSYSTSFGAATNLLGARHRQHVRNIYGLVRIADELVDGVAAAAALSPATQAHRLNALEQETETAVSTGYSSNPVVQSFANTARLSGIDCALIRPFFKSMRMDLPATTSSLPANFALTSQMNRFDAAAHAAYVYGSAEVVGLMCLRVFVQGQARSASDMSRLEHGARSLGAAFQNVNFLRDLADDTDRLQRNYLCGDAPFTEALKQEWIATIRAQLAEANAVLPLLPSDARVAVDCARRLFLRLTNKIAATPVDQLLTQRVRVSNPAKALLIVQSIYPRRKLSRV
ncbi:phytoene/squalene synthase family protein [Leucobacter sp. HY1910]